MTSPRVILHLDLDAFFCAVEEIKDPSLHGKAFAVGGSPTGRGVVTSCSYPARMHGIHSAMPMAQAVQLYPSLIVVSGDHRSYGHYSRKVMTCLTALSPQIEQISIDEAFLDITDLGSSPRAIGLQLQGTILEELDLPNSIGIAGNKLVAKIATDVGKHSAAGDRPPNAITVVPPGEEANFLAPLPVDMLWGVGPKTKERLEQIDIHTIGDLASYSVIELSRAFGKHGYDLSRRAQGIDQRDIVTEREIKSISNERTFREDIGRKSDVLKSINKLSKKVAQRLVSKNLRGRTIQIKLRWSDFTTLTRQKTLSKTTNDAGTIQRTASSLLDQVWEEGRLVRLVGVGVSNLDTEAQQLGLWDPEVKKDLQLQQALKDLRERFGEDVIVRGLRK